MVDQEITSTKPELSGKELIVQNTGEYAMLFDTALFNQSWRVAQAFATSGLVPDHFKDNPAGVFVVLHMATRMQLDPFMCLQKTYMVHGRPGMEAQLVIALVNARGPFTGPIQWKFEGEGKARKCTAYATHAKTGELCEATVTWAMVEAEGWNKDSTTRSGKIQKSKWNTLESLMFQYRSATFLARLYCPEVIMGLSTADELEDTAIVLDSGVTISHKPRMALPEVLEVDAAAVEQFDFYLSEQTVDEAVIAAVESYIAQIAKVNKQTVEAVKAQAGTPENFPAFWASFLAWHKPTSARKPRSDKGTTRNAHEGPSPEVATQGQGDGEVSPGGTVDSQGPDFLGICESLKVKGYSISTLEFKLGKKQSEWGEKELSLLTDMANQEA